MSVIATSVFEADPSQTFAIDNASLANWFKSSELSIERYGNHMLKSIGTSATDQTGKVIVNSVTGLVKLAQTAAITAAKAVGPEVGEWECNEDKVKTASGLDGKRKALGLATKLLDKETKRLKLMGDAIATFGKSPNDSIQNDLFRQVKKVSAAQVDLRDKQSELQAAINTLTDIDNFMWPFNGTERCGKRVRTGAWLRSYVADAPQQDPDSISLELVARSDLAGPDVSIYRDPMDKTGEKTGGKEATGGTGQDGDSCAKPPSPASPGKEENGTPPLPASTGKDEQGDEQGTPPPPASPAKEEKGIRYRNSVPGALKVQISDCVSALKDNPCKKGDHLFQTILAEGPVPQFGRLMLIPFANYAFQANKMQASFGDDGSLVSASYADTASRAEVASDTFNQLAGALLQGAKDLPTAGVNAKAAALNAKVAELQAQANLNSAKLALEPSGTEDNNRQTAIIMSDTTLKEAQLKNLEAADALQKAKEVRALP